MGEPGPGCQFEADQPVAEFAEAAVEFAGGERCEPAGFGDIAIGCKDGIDHDEQISRQCRREAAQ